MLTAIEEKQWATYLMRWQLGSTCRHEIVRITEREIDCSPDQRTCIQREAVCRTCGANLGVHFSRLPTPKKMVIVEKRGPKLNQWDTPTPAVGKCMCGALVSLQNPLSNECDCGRWFNIVGNEVTNPHAQESRLSDREDW